MGAHDFKYQVAGGEKDGERLFRRLAEADRSENGRGAYTGDIGQKGGFRVLNRRPLLPDEVDAFVDANRDQCDKWDQTACAATVAAATGKPRRKTVKVRAASKDEAVKKAVAKARSGKRPVRVKVVEVKPAGAVHSNKVRRKKHGGKAKVKWTCSAGIGLFDTPIQAAKAAEKHLVEAAREAEESEAKYGQSYFRTDTVVVYPVAVLEGNDGTTTEYDKKPVAYSVTIGRNDRAASWEVELELRTVNPDKVGGWVFFGWCAS